MRRPERRRQRPWHRAAALGACLLLFPLFTLQPAAAFCSKPVSPHCSADGTLADSYVSTSDCRDRTQDHVEALERYRECLQALEEETGREIRHLKELLDRTAGAPQA